MSLEKKVAYLKGLIDGMELDQDKKENQLIVAIADILEDMASDIAYLDEDIDSICTELDTIDEDLETICEDLDAFDEELDELYDDLYEDGDEDDDEESENEFDDDDFLMDAGLYEVACPNCGEDIVIEEDALEKGYILCPSCDEKLEFTFEDCGCDDCGHDHDHNHVHEETEA